MNISFFVVVLFPKVSVPSVNFKISELVYSPAESSETSFQASQRPLPHLQSDRSDKSRCQTL